jgi:predicted anti-sigma-YlaC factor YlaD
MKNEGEIFMRCTKAAWQLQLYLDQQLPLAEIRALEAHLSTCPACRAELHALEEVNQTLSKMEQVIEPANLTTSIMQRVARDVQQKEYKVYEPSFVPFRLSLQELLAAILLATVSTLGLILAQPAVRTMLPVANGHDALSMLFIGLMQNLTTMNAGTLSLILWIIGTILGVWITLALAGGEMRSEWYKTITDRLPVW